MATLLQWQPWAPKNLDLALLGSFAALEIVLGLFLMFVHVQDFDALTCHNFASLALSPPILILLRSSLPASELVSVTPCIVRHVPVRDACGT